MLGAVNSINLASIVAQVVYYFHSYFQLIKISSLQIGDEIRFVVPTGNFGNVLAGPTLYSIVLSYAETYP
jgi:threonine synthase